MITTDHSIITTTTTQPITAITNPTMAIIVIAQHRLVKFEYFALYLKKERKKILDLPSTKKNKLLSTYLFNSKNEKKNNLFFQHIVILVNLNHYSILPFFFLQDL